jgi:hypothetical protein|tara:strand:- start:99 stop:794 length:696 start_codon:yes stop_codon:yes gene_type:complete
MNQINTHIYISILILAFIFNRLYYVDKKTLLSIIIIIIIGFFLFININKQQDKKLNSINELNNKINNNLKYINDLDNNNYIVSKLPKELKYLLKDHILVNILVNIEFIKKFNKSLYTNILINTDKMMKIYIFILNDLYNPITHISLFNDMRINILEQLYSIILIIPLKFKHTYGFDPIIELNKTIKNFTMRTRKMISIIEKYSKYEKKIEYLEDTIYTPYNRISKLKNILP